MSLQQELDKELEQELNGQEPVVEAQEEQQQEEQQQEQEVVVDEDAVLKDALGFQSKEEWVASGKDPEKYRDWETFKEWGKQLPVMQANMKKMTQVIAKLQEENKRAAALGYQQAIQELSKKQIQAAQEEDWDTYGKLETEKGKKYQEMVQQNVEQDVPDEVQMQVQQEEIKYIQKHPWIQNDKEVIEYSNAISAEIGQKYQHLTIPQRFIILDKELRQRFPDRYNRTAKQQGGVMKNNNGAAKAPIKTNTQKGYDSLPADVKAVADKYVAKGLFKDGNEYAKEYWNEMNKNNKKK